MGDKAAHWVNILYNNLSWGGVEMEKAVDKTLTCRACGKDFTFTVGEQEFFAKKGLSQPNRCKQCREENRRQNSRPICSECGLELGTSAYCSTCVQNLKQQFEFKLQSEQKRVENLESNLENLSKLEGKLALLAKGLDSSKESISTLLQKVESLEVENSKVASVAASQQDLEALVHLLSEQFESFREIYRRNIQELIQSHLALRDTVIQKQESNPFHRLASFFQT